MHDVSGNKKHKCDLLYYVFQTRCATEATGTNMNVNTHYIVNHTHIHTCIYCVGMNILSCIVIIIASGSQEHDASCLSN